MAKFKKEVLDMMKSDPDLFGVLLKALKVAPASLPVIINRNGRTLNQFSIVALVAKHLGKKPEDLMEKESRVKETAK